MREKKETARLTRKTVPASDTTMLALATMAMVGVRSSQTCLSTWQSGAHQIASRQPNDKQPFVAYDR